LRQRKNLCDWAKDDHANSGGDSEAELILIEFSTFDIYAKSGRQKRW
jgi:hypothetical protein